MNHSRRIRVSIVGICQLLMCLLALGWAWRIWHQADNVYSDRFWGVIALAVFAGGLAQINLIAPLREWLHRPPTSRLALPIRLAADGAHTGLEWPMFSLAIAFAAPILPLVLLVSNLETAWMVDLEVVWIGMVLLAVCVVGISLFLGGQALYKRLLGGQTVVEVERATVQAGQTVQGFVWHHAGRLPTQHLEVILTARETFTRYSRPQRIDTTTLHHEVLCAVADRDLTGEPWQQRFSYTIPAKAPSSTPHTANPTISWGLAVRFTLKDAPGFTLTFPFTVQDRTSDADKKE